MARGAEGSASLPCIDCIVPRSVAGLNDIHPGPRNDRRSTPLTPPRQTILRKQGRVGGHLQFRRLQNRAPAANGSVGWAVGEEGDMAAKCTG